MFEQVRKHQRVLLIALIAVCLGVALIGGAQYFQKLKNNLLNTAIQDVKNVTLQQKQSFDNFISIDRENLHRYAEYFSKNGHDASENDQDLLAVFAGADANFAVTCLEDSWTASGKYGKVLRIAPETLEEYHSLSGSGIRDNYIGLVSGVPKFSFYETFTFRNGHSGLVQKAYDRSKVLETFSLSLYNGQGYGYILDQNGDILLRSVQTIDKDSGRTYDNVFTALTDTHGPREDIDAFKEALGKYETGSIIFTGDKGRFVYTYTPVESVEGWYLLSIVPEEVILEESDRMLQGTQTALVFLVTILIFCVVLYLLIWRTQKDIDAKDREVKYQASLFEVFFDYIAENTDDVYMLLEPANNQIEYSTPNLERVFGLSRQELIDNIQSFESTNTAGEKIDLASLRRMKPGAGTGDILVERINRKTGERRWFLDRTRCVQIQGVNKLICYSSDRTKEQKTQNRLSEALHMANAANDAKSAFLSNVSHDIRTPMNAIIGFLSLMKDETENPAAVKEYIEHIDTASQHLLGLINDVLDISKIESGNTTLSISEINLADIIGEINAIVRPQAQAKNQTFDIIVPHLIHEQLLGDKMRINQILINLLSNAVKYTQEGGEIQLLVEERPQLIDHYSRVCFTVRDNGLGMSEDYQKVIFEPFTREETEITHEIQGTGLGMPITKSLVDLMGGTICVESLPGKGSSFAVELNLRIQQLDDDAEFWSEHKIARVLVVDDKEQICLAIVKAMSKAGVAADYTTVGYTAVQMLQEHRNDQPYDFVLLDWKMPVLDGLETAKLIRRDYSDEIPILLLTAYDWGDIKKEAMEAGVNDCMPKPFFMSTFKEIVKQIMSSQNTHETRQNDVVRDKHILVVDDVDVNRILLTKILTTLGAACDTAANGQEAVDKFEASRPGEYDLIMMDIQMPVLDGYGATKAIRGGGHPAAQSVPIIAMTANAFADDVRKAIESGMDAHVAKPVQIDNLKATIQQVLESRAE